MPSPHREGIVTSTTLAYTYLIGFRYDKLPLVDRLEALKCIREGRLRLEWGTCVLREITRN